MENNFFSLWHLGIQGIKNKKFVTLRDEIQNCENLWSLQRMQSSDVKLPLVTCLTHTYVHRDGWMRSFWY